MNLLDYFFLRDIKNFDLVNRHFFTKEYDIPEIKQLKIVVSIRDFEYDHSTAPLNAISLLESITAAKGLSKRYSVFLKKVRNKKKLCFLGLLTIRRSRLMNFLYFLVFFIFLRLKIKFLKINEYISNNDAHYYFSLRKFNILDEFLQFSFRKWAYPLHFFFSINGSDPRISASILRSYGVYTYINISNFQSKENLKN